MSCASRVILGARLSEVVAINDFAEWLNAISSPWTNVQIVVCLDALEDSSSSDLARLMLLIGSNSRRAYYTFPALMQAARQEVIRAEEYSVNNLDQETPVVFLTNGDSVTDDVASIMAQAARRWEVASISFDVSTFEALAEVAAKQGVDLR